MTVIAVKREEKYIHLVCDSRITTGSERVDGKSIAMTKVINNGDLYIGIAGDCNENTYLSVFMQTNIPAGSTMKDIIEYFCKFVSWYKSITGITELHGRYIVVYKGKIYSIWSQGLHIFEISEFEAIGSGSYFAITALHLGKNAAEAVKIACELDAFCEDPVHEYFIENV